MDTPPFMLARGRLTPGSGTGTADKESLGIWMPWMPEQLLSLADLDYLSQGT